MLLRLMGALCCAAALAGCAGVDYEAVGDRHSTQGNHAAAYDAYRQVPAGGGSPELPRKTEQALAKAMDDFVDQAQRALEDRRYEEALRIARDGLKYQRDDRLRDIERQARERTVSNAVELGRTYLSQRQFLAAIEQFETARRYGESADVVRLLAEAKRGHADELEAQAKQLAAAGDFDAALVAITAARNFDDGPSRRATQDTIERERAAAIDRKYEAAVSEGRGILAAKEWPAAADRFQAALRLKNAEPAIGLHVYATAMQAGDAAWGRRDWSAASTSFRAALATGHDGGDAQQRLDALAAERQARLAQGRAALTAMDWAAAQAAFRDARSMADDAEVAAWLRYATAMLEGEQAASARDFDGAEAAFRRAQGAGVDDGGVAALRATAVRPSTWAITIDRVTCMPFKPDDGMWDSVVTKALPVERIMAGYRAGAPGKEAAEAASNLVPEKNLPDPFVRFWLPDGGRFETKTARGVLHALVGATLTVRANAYDERELAIDVLDDDRPGVDDRDRRGEAREPELIGSLRVKLSELLGKGAASAWNFGQVYELTVRLENRGAAPPGVVQGAVPLDAPPPAAGNGADTDARNTAPGRSKERPGCACWHVRLIETFVGQDDIDDEGREGEADPRVQIEQGGTVVFEHTLDADIGGRTWEEAAEQPRTVLWVAADDAIVVRLLDVDPDGADEVLRYELRVADLEGGTIRLDNGRGSRVVFTARKG